METLKQIFEWLKKKVAALFNGGDTVQKPVPTKTPNTSAKPHASEPYVFVTARGKKYHWDRLCPSLLNAKEIKMDISKARKAGYIACDKCCSAAIHKYD